MRHVTTGTDQNMSLHVIVDTRGVAAARIAKGLAHTLNEKILFAPVIEKDIIKGMVSYG